MEFGVLGVLRVRHGGRALRPTGTRQSKVLAALLIDANTVVPMDRLVAVLWDGEPPPTAVRQVQDTVSGIRGLFRTAGLTAEALVSHPRGYQILAQPEQLDLLRFEHHLELAGQAERRADPAAEAAALRAALECWRGAALTGIDSAVLNTDAARLEGSRLTAWRTLAGVELALGRHHEIGDELLALLATHPFDERLIEYTLLALHRSGRRAEALAVFRQARRSLGEELGLEPRATLRQLHEQILDDDPALDWQPPEPPRQTDTETRPDHEPHDTPAPSPAQPGTIPAQLPRDVADFVGRDKLLAEVEAGLGGEPAGGATAVCTVTGSGGIGKTVFAVHAAHRLSERFPDGQLFADLRGSTDPPKAAEDVLDGFLRALGVDSTKLPVAADERGALFRSLLAGRRILIVLDDARDAAQVRPLLPGSPTCAALITSRRWLANLDGARRLELGVLDPDDALALFAGVIGPERAAAEPDSVQDVLTLCAGLPLAIRVAAARLAVRPGWPVRTLADRLADQADRLDELQTEGLAVRASLAVGYAGLPRPDSRPDRPGRSDLSGQPGGPGPHGPDPARAFRLLGLWNGATVSVPAAAALLGRPPRLTASDLEHLVDVHLLEPAGPDRYRFHDLVKIYAAECADRDEDQAERRAALERLLDWYLHAACAAEAQIAAQPSAAAAGLPEPAWPPPAFTDRDQALDWCQSELDTAVAAVAQAADLGLDRVATRLPVALRAFHDIRSHWSEWVAGHEIGLSAARRAGDPAFEAALLNGLGVAHCRLRRFDAGIDRFAEALAIRRHLDDRAGEANTLVNLGAAYDDLGRPQEGIQYTLQARTSFQDAGDRRGEAACLNNVAWAQRGLGRLEEAAGHSEEALRLARDIGDRRLESEFLLNLGVIHLLQGRLPEAGHRFQQSLQICQDLGYRYGQAEALDGIGWVGKEAGQPGPAREAWRRAHAIFQDLGHPRAREIAQQIEDLD